MKILRALGAAAIAVAMLLVGGVTPAWADYVDASDSNDVLPQQYDYSLLESDGFSIVPGYEEQARQDADLQWTECLEQINYARSGAGLGGIGGWIYVSDQTYKCQTFQVVTRPIEAPFEVGYELSHIDAANVMAELRKGNAFLQHEGSVLSYDEEQMATAEEELAGDMAAEAVERNGGGDAAQWVADQAAEAAVSNGASVEAVSAVTNPAGALDRFVNQLKEDAGKAIAQGLGYVSQGMSFSGGLSSYRQVYAAAAGVGLVLLAAGSVVSLVRLRRGGLPVTEVLERWASSLVLGFFGLVFTPAWLFVCTELADGMSAGVVNWLGTSSTVITGSLLDPFNALTTANSPLGWLGALVVCVLFFLAGVMLVLTFAIQFLAAYFGSVGLGVMWGLVMSEGGRRRLAMAVALVVGAIFARPVLLFMVGAAMTISSEFTASADGWSTDPMGTLFRLLLGVGAILMVCFAPAGLTRFMPVVGGGGAGHARVPGLGALVGGSVAGSMMGSRMHALASRVRGGGRSLSGASRSSGQGAGGRARAGVSMGGPGAVTPPGASSAQGGGVSSPSATAGRHLTSSGPGSAPVSRSRSDAAAGTSPTAAPQHAGQPGATSGAQARPTAAPQHAGQPGATSGAQARPTAAAAMTPTAAPGSAPGRRLGGADLMGAVQQVAAGGMRAGGAVAAGAAVAGMAAVGAGRVAAYEGAQFARTVEEAAQ